MIIVGRQLRCRAARFARGMGPDKVWQNPSGCCAGLTLLHALPCAHGPSRAAPCNFVGPKRRAICLQNSFAPDVLMQFKRSIVNILALPSTLRYTQNFTYLKSSYRLGIMPSCPWGLNLGLIKFGTYFSTYSYKCKIQLNFYFEKKQLQITEKFTKLDSNYKLQN